MLVFGDFHHICGVGVDFCIHSERCTVDPAILDSIASLTLPSMLLLLLLLLLPGDRGALPVRR
jgi:hypothetical protein